MSTSDFIQWPGWAPFLCLCLVSGLVLFRAKKQKILKSPVSHSPKDDVEPTSYPPVEPLPDFEWQKKEPLKLRPFKPKYHLTMSTNSSTFPTSYMRDIAN